MSLRLFGPLVFDASDLERKQRQRRIVAVDFVGGTDAPTIVPIRPIIAISMP